MVVDNDPLQAALREAAWLREQLQAAITRQDILRNVLREAGLHDPTINKGETSCQSISVTDASSRNACTVKDPTDGC